VLEAWLGEIFDGGDTLSDIRDIVAWSEHSCSLYTQLPPSLHFTYHRTRFGPPVMLECRFCPHYRGPWREGAPPKVGSGNGL
jgi:hypothetical protein